MIYLITGQKGSGKSYIAVNHFLRDYLRTSNRHIYTNLPVVIREDGTWEVVHQMTKSPARRAEYMKRCHLLRNVQRHVPEWKDPDPRNPVTYPAGDHNEEAEFWYFTRVNSVILLDELADVWPADGVGIRKAETLGEYARMQRHMKDDLFCFSQNHWDLVSKFRRHIDVVYDVGNSTRENMFETAWLKGLKWPIQFFRVREYQAQLVIESKVIRAAGVPDESNFAVWPRKWGFKTYKSFSPISRLGYKGEPSEEAESSDVNVSLARRWAGFIRAIPTLMALVGGIIGAAILFYMGIGWLLHPEGTIESIKRNTDPNKGAAQGEVGKGTVLAPAGKAGVISKVGTNGAPVAAVPDVQTNAVPPERVVLVTPARLLTTRGSYELGDMVGGYTAVRFMLDGFVGPDGRAHLYSVVFPRRRNPGG